MRKQTDKELDKSENGPNHEMPNDESLIFSRASSAQSRASLAIISNSISRCKYA